jgi:16S rRNA (guanine966-N2)-methyltransferase
MKVIAGIWRGRKIETPAGAPTRPTSARLREAIFSALQGRWVDRPVLDLFAGSGALGIEALSRRALRADFYDIDSRALRAIAANLERLGADPSCWRVRRADAWRLLDRAPAEVAEGSIVLADPPWTEGLVARCLPGAARWVESGRVSAFVLEHPAGDEAADAELPPTVEWRIRRHGPGAYSLLVRRDP